MQRATVIHDYCVTLTRDNCLDLLGGSSFIYQQARGCSLDGGESRLAPTKPNGAFDPADDP
jgi:hypothetical protein